MDLVALVEGDFQLNPGSRQEMYGCNYREWDSLFTLYSAHIFNEFPLMAHVNWKGLNCFLHLAILMSQLQGSSHC